MSTRLLAAATILALFFLFNENTSNIKKTTVNVKIALSRRLGDSSALSNNNAVTTVLQRGDLPAYTGWSRPIKTDAELYHLESISNEPVVNQALRLKIACKECAATAATAAAAAAAATAAAAAAAAAAEHNSNAHFYARMYGPSVLPGYVTALGNGEYEVIFFPQDAGVYSIEVVLTFSSTPDFVEFPVANVPGYEGYLLPGFPLQQTVIEDSSTPATTATTTETRLPFCSAKELELNDMFDGLERGRWKVIEKHEATPESPLGITMDYQPSKCSIATTPQILDQCLYSHVAATYKPLRLILVGDSVMGLQYQQIQEMGIAGVELSYIYTTTGGLEASYQNITTQLTSLIKPDEERMVLFNSGMHDIMLVFNQRHNVSNDEQYYRTYHYRQALAKLTNFLATYPASSKVFQLTTAAWPLWGNWGFPWPINRHQHFIMSTHWAEQYNRIAMHVIQQQQQQQQSSNIKVMDAYWMSLARPDNREISCKGIRSKLAHPGKEVLSAMVRTYLTIVISNLGCFA